jgi:hypothetical protein
MPEISQFFGISIKMFYGDHAPPHFHVEYAGHKAIVDIRTLMVIGGSIPPRAQGMVIEWAMQHQKELAELWQRAEGKLPLYRVAPLE